MVNLSDFRPADATLTPSRLHGCLAKSFENAD
jgi:hypothetical protein